jgi:hypothetical protein
MHPSDDPFYARLPTLSDAELFNYTHNYSHYKVEAVQAAIAELRTRGLYLSWLFRSAVSASMGADFWMEPHESSSI